MDYDYKCIYNFTDKKVNISKNIVKVKRVHNFERFYNLPNTNVTPEYSYIPTKSAFFNSVLLSDLTSKIKIYAT